MYLNTKTHPVDDAKRINSILAHQIMAWIFESHCWVEDPEAAELHKTCMWCEAKSSKDGQEDGKEAPDLCPKNPVMEVYRTELAAGDGTAKEGIDEHQQTLNQLKKRKAEEDEEGDANESG